MLKKVKKQFRFFTQPNIDALEISYNPFGIRLENFKILNQHQTVISLMSTQLLIELNHSPHSHTASGLMLPLLCAMFPCRAIKDKDQRRLSRIPISCHFLPKRAKRYKKTKPLRFIA